MPETFKKLLQDPEISEIMIDGPHLVRIEKKGEVIDTKVRFKSTQELQRLVDSLHEGRKATDETPVRESRLEDGTRVTSVSGRGAIGGPFVHIVKLRREAPNWQSLQEWKFVDKNAAAIFSAIIKKGESLLASGTAWSGQTTLVNLLSSQIQPVCRVIGVETSGPLDIQRQHPHVILLSASGEVYPWIQTARRLRPDVIVTGETTGAEAFELIRAAQERTQVITSIRATGVADALRRIELQCLQANAAWSVADHRQQIAQSLRFISFQDVLRGSSNRRVVREITEVVGFDNGKYALEPLVRWNEKSDRFEVTARGQDWIK